MQANSPFKTATSSPHRSAPGREEPHAVAALGLGAVFGGLALDRGATAGSHCPQHLCDPTGLEASRQGKGYALVANAGLATAGAAGALSLFLLWPVIVPVAPSAIAALKRPNSTEPNSRQVTLGLTPSGVVLGGRF